MKSKRIFSLLLMLCMLVSVLAPAATAIQLTAAEIIKGSVTQGNLSTNPDKNNGLIISGDNAIKGNTLRDDLSFVNNKYVDISLRDGKWVATKIDGTTATLSDARLPEDLKKLTQVADKYTTQDVVEAFIVLEDAPSAERYNNILDVPQEEADYLASQQSALIALIEEEVLGGQNLQVITQFTYFTNAVVVKTTFGQLTDIAVMDGVKSVFLSPVYSVCETKKVTYPSTVSSGNMTGTPNVWKDLGYTGAGMTIAVLDTGLDLDHPSFAADPMLAESSWTMEYVQQLLDQYELNCEVLYKGTLTGENLYYNAKVPFAFNYSMGTTNVSHNDGVGDHGTHVSGIAAANPVDGSGVVGMAPDAQIITMKVFNSETGGANMYDIIAAMEDCMILGVDVVNMSLGSPAGFPTTELEEIDSIFERISETDIIIEIAAGNEATSSYGSSFGAYMQTTEHIDNATISSPSTYKNVLSIASVDNMEVYASYFALADGTRVFYMQCVEYHYGYLDYNLEILAGDPVEYVIVPGLGEEADFYDENGNSIVEGKIAVVSRGVTTFGDKAFNAQNAGAVGVLIWDNVSEDIFSFGLYTSITDEEGNEVYPTIPVSLISLEDGQKMAAAADKSVDVADTAGLRADSHGGQMSTFSCWGVSPDLGLLPDMAGVGGNVYSCYDNGQYGIMSGTSMATPQVAGMTALLLQYLKAEMPTASADEMRTMVYSLLMSTAVPVIDNTTGLEASPRQQGAGLVDIEAAITAGAYLTVPTSDRPKAELGDSKDGKYTFTFTVHNYSDADKTYTLSSSLLCEDYFTDEAYPGLYFMAEADRALDNSAVSFDKDSVTVAAGGTATVTVTIDLTEADKQWIDTYFPSGNYVEGFVYLKGEGENTLSLPFLGFYGSWDAAPVFDTGFWYEDGFWVSTYDEVVADSFANEYYHILWTNIAGSDWVLGLNPYEGVQIDENGHIIYSTDNNVISPNGDGALDKLTEFYISLMRNAEELRFVYTDEAGNVLHEELMPKESKTMYISGYGSVVPFVYSWFYDNLYDFTDANGNPLADGSTVYLTISGSICYEGAREDILATFPLHIDTTAPELDTDNIVESSDENGNYLTLTFTDEHPAFLATMNTTGTQLYKRYSDLDMVKNADGTYSITIDVTGLGDTFSIVLCDYGCNESSYALTWSQTGTNNPEVDYDALYAYQVYNEYLFYYYGWDYMFGWSTIDKGNATVEMLQSDIYEYYALNAAEYVGGYVFAVDAGYNFLYMEPGLWNRNTICNLGVNVLDMAWDDVSETMYLITKTEEEYAMYTVDLLTGDLTLLKAYDSYYDMPWAMTFVDGKLYCCRYYFNGFYQVDIEGGTYELTNVTLADGSKFTPKSSSGSATSALYSQSMTYSEKDGVIYWAYFGDGISDLIVIDPKTWECNPISFGFEQEYVGLLTLEDGGYVLPSSDKVTKLVIDNHQLIMAAGNTSALKATPLPWNAPAVDIVWTSSNENVAIVDQNGNVTAISEGEADIFATYEGMTVSCNVVVVDISGTLNAYNYYSGDGAWGSWLSIDLKDMAIEGSVESSVDFIAADYNGHNGLIYGYDEFGQCYIFDPATGECTTLGNGGNAVPADMAYDYTTGIMYAIVHDYNSWTTTLYGVSPSSGALVEVASVRDVFVTWACDMEGTFYGINYDGQLYSLTLEDGKLSSELIMQTPSDMLHYAQSMCYDHINDVLLWVSVENSTIYWVDVHNSTPYAMSLGEPTNSGYIEFVGLHVVPNEDQIPELPTVKATGLDCSDMIMLIGEEIAPSVTILPVNTTNQSNYTFTSRKTDVVKVVNGKLVAVGEGVATIYVSIPGTTIRQSFTVTVKKGTGSLNGFLLSDVGSMDGYYWMGLEDTDPNNYHGVEYVYYNGTYMLVYAAEYVNGYIYAYGYDYDDWNANFHYLVIDAKTWSVISATDMGDSFGFVYDMAFDYTTGTMYALCGPSDSASDLYYVDLQTGKMIPCMLTDPMFMSLAIDANGTIYAMESSSGGDELSGEAATSAKMYILDPEKGTMRLFMDTGVPSNMLASMTYDYDTGYIYWTGLYQTETGYISGLYLLDLAEKACYNLGTIGRAGAQVTGLMSFSDNYPQIPTNLKGLTIVSTREELAEGTSMTLDVFLQPAGIAADLTWASSDESVATVDQNGTVTAVSSGTVTITVTATDEGKTYTSYCTVIVYGEDDFFITYNGTDGGFTAVLRPDPSNAINLTEKGTDPAVSSMAMVDGVIYGYDEEGNLFVTSADADFQRTYIGHCGIEVEEGYTSDSVNSYYTYHYEYEYTFTIRDMAWDPVNNRLLALGCAGMLRHATMTVVSTGEVSYYTDNYELSGGCKLYEVDLQTGLLTEVITVGGSSPEAGVTMLTVTDAGEVYIYSYFMDYVSRVNMETGKLEFLTTYQNQGVYGDADGAPMAMTYDANTDSLYMLFTQNGKAYYLYRFDCQTYAISLVGSVGKLLSNTTDHFSGLVLNQEHTCEYEVVDCKDATCTEEGYIDYTCQAHGICYREILPALGHKNELVDSKGATCTEDGSVTHKCSVCGEETVTVIPAPGHSYKSVVTVGNCTEGGYTTYTCTKCGDTYVDDKVDATGHDYKVTETKNATCTEDGYVKHTCSNCGDTYSTTIAATGHSYESVVTKPTCTEGGYTTHTCSVCGHSFVDSKTEATGHSYESVVTKPTCTEGGYTTHTCSVCGHSFVDSKTEAAGHSYESVVTKSTCTEDGYTTHTCSVCGDHYTDSKTEATGHSYVDHKCEHCGKGEPDPENPKTGNSLISVAVVAAVLSLMSIVALPVARKKLF